MAFRCSACGAEFETKEALDAHVLEEHQDKPTASFRCPACGAEFETQEELDAHTKTDHPA